jgi:hypothetical protein
MERNDWLRVLRMKPFIGPSKHLLSHLFRLSVKLTKKYVSSAVFAYFRTFILTSLQTAWRFEKRQLAGI